jgi:signal transduction histidine kinase
MVRRVLSNKGLQTLTAPRWNSAIALAQETQPDLVLIDFDLPGIGGNVLAARLRSLPGYEGTPMIALVSPGQHGQVLGFGFSGSFEKPLNPRQLPNDIARFAHKRVLPLEKEAQIEHLNQLLVETTGRLEEQELELEAKERRLREANRLRGNFLINVSRELRTPLTLISGYVTLLQSTIHQLDLENTPLSLDEMVEGMVQGTKRMNDVVGELMRVSRIVTGDVSLALGPTRVQTLVSATLSELTDKERAVVEQGPLEELPIVQVDGNQVRLAIRNLLTHLITIIPEGKRIFLNGRRQQDIVILSMDASGIELDPAEQEMLFDRLYPIDGSGKEDPKAQQRKSLGFGLAVANGIIQAHNGRMWIESTGEGEQSKSTFYLLLPVSS